MNNCTRFCRLVLAAVLRLIKSRANKKPVLKYISTIKGHIFLQLADSATSSHKRTIFSSLIFVMFGSPPTINTQDLKSSATNIFII